MEDRDVDDEQSRELSDEDKAAAAAASAGAAAGSQNANVEHLEVLLSQLQIKIEAMDATMQDNIHSTKEPAEGTATKVDLEGIELPFVTCKNMSLSSHQGSHLHLWSLKVSP